MRLSLYLSLCPRLGRCDSANVASHSEPRLTFRPSLSARLAPDISSLKRDKGLALQDIIQGIYDLAATIVFSPQTRVYFLDQIAQVECVSRLPSPLVSWLVRGCAGLTDMGVHQPQAPPLDGRERETPADGAPRRDKDVRVPRLLRSFLALR